MTVLMASASPYNDVEAIPSGLGVDKITGIGGFPRKRITEVFGDSSLGKSTLCLQLIANAQRLGYKCLFADIEWSFDTEYAKKLGVDVTKLGLIHERYAEDALNTLEKEIETGDWGLVVLDSVGGLLPRSEAEKETGQKTIGGQASLVAAFCRKVVPILVLRAVALVVINHSFVDIMSGAIKTSGGKKLEYHKSLSIRLKAKPNVVLKVGDKKVGKVVVAEIKKNKLASTEGAFCDMQLLFGEGFSASADLLQDALDKGIITKQGNTHFMGEEKLGMIGKVRELMKDEGFLERLKEAMTT